MASHPLFTTLSFFAIIGNTIILAMERHPMTKSEEQTLRNWNITFSIAFAVEMVIKLWSLGGVMNYAKDPFNIFDAILVIISIIDIAI